MAKKIKSPIRKIRAKVYMQAVFIEAHLPKKIPKWFARKFEPEKISRYEYGKNISNEGIEREIYSPKWERNINGDTLPSKSLVELISKSCPKSEKYYTSLLWIALKAGQQNKTYWLKFYQKLPASFKRILRQGQKDTLRNEQLKFVNGKKILTIYNYLNEDALACLIVILRIEYQEKHPMSIMCSLIEHCVFALLSQILSKQPYAAFAFEIFTYITKYIIHHNLTANNEQLFMAKNNTQLAINLALINESLLNAKKHNIIKTKKDKADFLYWLLQTPLLLTWVELQDEIIHSPIENFDFKGLHWIIENINDTRCEDQKISLPVNSSNT